MKLEEYLKVIEKFLQDYLQSTNAKGYVLGISGGVDSSLVSVLTRKAVGKDKVTGIMLPINSLKEDLEDALELVKAHDINYLVIDGSDIFNQYVEAFKKQGVELDTATKSNLKARIRMSILYAYAQKNSLLVLGTDNKDERYTGYFTKHGDGAADLFPIAKLLKREVVEASKILGISTRLAERVPSAGLFPGQTDEKEMGITYKELDDYLIGKPINEETKKRIEYLHRISEHKRALTPEPEEFIRDEE
ncbi:MAG: NAD(+) synthase [Bacilli bacterium]|nr:NAD(+) synthase [Bacilli bacterium]